MGTCIAAASKDVVSGVGLERSLEPVYETTNLAEAATAMYLQSMQRQDFREFDR